MGCICTSKKDHDEENKANDETKKDNIKTDKININDKIRVDDKIKIDDNSNKLDDEDSSFEMPKTSPPTRVVSKDNNLIF